MSKSFKMLERNHFLSTSVGLVREWRTQDTVSFSQLVDFTAVGSTRDRYKSLGLAAPSYTAFIVDAVASALCKHPKLNRIVYRGPTGYRWAQFDRIDIAVAVELVEGDLDIAYASIIRNADQLGLEGIADALLKLASAPKDDLQLRRLRRFPPSLAALLARSTRLHPSLWVRFRGGSCAVTSPGKYGVDGISAKTSWPVTFAFGKVAERPMVVNGCCVPRLSVILSMAWHRELTTGAVAVRFFDQIVQKLQAPC